MNDAALVIAAHPDDEILGCGGAIAKHVACGDAIEVCILAEGITSRSNKRDRGQAADELRELAACAEKANAVLGCNFVSLHDFPDNRMDSVPLLDIVKIVDAHLGRLRPTTVYTHHPGDVNVDHKIVHDAVIAACRPQPGNSVRTLLFFEVPSSTEWRPGNSATPFLPNWFVDISAELDRKLKALSEYSGEMRAWPHPRSLRSVEHLARWRGSTIGVDAAEAFALGRRIG